VADRRGATGSIVTMMLVPTVSRFFGIVITMYFDEHGIPHFHTSAASTRP
jgi:hypothetical protein